MRAFDKLKSAELIYSFIVQFKAEHDGVAPSFQQISKGTGIASYGHIRFILDRLEEEGRIKQGEGQRNIQVTDAVWTPPEVVQAS